MSASSSLKLSGKYALVTGASEGIGRSIALDLAANGAFVIVNSRSETKSQKVVTEITQKGGQAVAIAADVSQLSQIKTLFEKIASITPKLDIVINNAGTADSKSIVEVTEEDYDKLFNLNTKGAFFVLQNAAKVIADGGRIIIISTTATKLTLSGFSVYLASKAALDQISKSLSIELAGRKVSVNTVSPGYTHTPLLPESYHDIVAQASLFKKVGLPQDISNLVTFLVLPESWWITGQNIHVNGGASFS